MKQMNDGCLPLYSYSYFIIDIDMFNVRQTITCIYKKNRCEVRLFWSGYWFLDRKEFKYINAYVIKQNRHNRCVTVV